MGYGRLSPRVARVPDADAVAVCGVWEVLGGLEGGGGGKRLAISTLCQPGHQNMPAALAPRLLAFPLLDSRGHRLITGSLSLPRLGCELLLVRCWGFGVGRAGQGRAGRRGR